MLTRDQLNKPKQTHAVPRFYLNFVRKQVNNYHWSMHQYMYYVYNITYYRYKQYANMQII